MPDARATARAVARGGKPAAMVALHYAGHPAPVEEAATGAGLGLDHVVEDAAHAAGTVADGRLVGALSAATCFSFYATKNLAIGEGGMVTTNLADVADYVRRCRLHGISRDSWQRRGPGSSWGYSVDNAGLKANMTDVQAAIGRAQLQCFSEYQARREAIVARYDRGLAGIRGLHCRPARGRRPRVAPVRGAGAAGIRRLPRRADREARRAGDRVLGALHSQSPAALPARAARRASRSEPVPWGGGGEPAKRLAAPVSLSA